MGETKVWLNILGWSFIISGVLYCLTIVGLVIGWLPIWAGLSLTKASKAATNVQQSGSAEEVINYLDGLKVYLTITGIGALLGVIFAIGMFFVGLTGGLAALMELSEPTPYRY